MANTVPAKYTVGLNPTVTPEIAGELAAWGEVRQVSISAVIRECIEGDGLSGRRIAWTREHGPLDAHLLERHTAAARVRGERQVRTRRDYDSRTRAGETTFAQTKQERKATKSTGRQRAEHAAGGAA